MTLISVIITSVCIETIIRQDLTWIIEILKLMYYVCMLNCGHAHLTCSLFSEGTTPAVEHEEPELLDMLNMMVSKVTAPIMM